MVPFGPFSARNPLSRFEKSEISLLLPKKELESAGRRKLHFNANLTQLEGVSLRNRLIDAF